MNYEDRLLAWAAFGLLGLMIVAMVVAHFWAVGPS